MSEKMFTLQGGETHAYVFHVDDGAIVKRLALPPLPLPYISSFALQT